MGTDGSELGKLLGSLGGITEDDTIAGDGGGKGRRWEKREERNEPGQGAQVKNSEPNQGYLI